MSSTSTYASKDPFRWVGSTLAGKYRIDEVVAEGGFGLIYKGHHQTLDETVAVKCLKIPGTLRLGDREKFAEAFVAEGRLLHKLSKSSTGIVQCLDVGAEISPSGAWTPYLILEWLEGVSLLRVLRERRRAGKGGRSLAEAVALLDSAARALAVAHAQGVAHRDVKPSNLFFADVAGKPTLKVLDFGIAKVLSDPNLVRAASATTGSISQAFTPRYGAPEQFSRRYGATGPWTDVFAFALVLVEVVLNDHALQGDDATDLYIATSDLRRRPTLRTRGVDVPDELERALLKALAVDPKRRFESMGEFWDAVTAAVPVPAAGATAPFSGSAWPVSFYGAEPDVVELSASDVQEIDDPDTGAGVLTTPLPLRAPARPSVPEPVTLGPSWSTRVLQGAQALARGWVGAGLAASFAAASVGGFTALALQGRALEHGPSPSRQIVSAAPARTVAPLPAHETGAPSASRPRVTSPDGALVFHVRVPPTTVVGAERAP